MGLNPYISMYIHVRSTDTYGIKLYKLSIYKVQEPKSKPLVMPVEMAFWATAENFCFFLLFFFT